MTSKLVPWLLAGWLVLLGGCDRPTGLVGAAPPGRTWTTPPFAEADGGVIAARLPRTVHGGGPILRHPELTTVTFTGDRPAMVARLERFGDVIATTAWWHEVVDSFCLRPDDCIGDGRPGRHVHLARTLPATLSDVDLERLLGEEVRSGALARLGKDALVLVYLPPGVTLRDASHPHYCAGGPRAYHRMLRSGRASFAYAVMPRCDDEAGLTGTASHEILEASTNPDPQRHGFRLDPGSNNGGFTAAGTEPADPCGLLSLDRPPSFESGFAVQRAWSDRAARGGHDPCVPAPAQAPYLALMPQTPTVRLASLGATVAIRLDAASDRAVAAWAVSAIDLTGQQEGERYVEAALDRESVKAGDTAVLTLRLEKLHPQRMAVVGVVSTLGPHSHLWPIAVSMR